MNKYLILMVFTIFCCCNKKNDFTKNKTDIKILDNNNDTLKLIDFDLVDNNIKSNYLKTNKNNLSDTIVAMYKNFDKLNIEEIDELMFLIEKSKNRYNDLYLYLVYKVNKKDDNNFPILERSAIYYYDLLVSNPYLFYKYLETRDSNYKAIIKAHIDNSFANFPDNHYKDSLCIKHKQEFKKSNVDFIFK